MTLAIIQAEVKDFTEWKKIFDADQPNVEKAGAKLLGVYRDLNNPNAVTMLYEGPGPELYEKMMSDPHRQEDIKRAGVIGAPKASFYNKVD